MVPHCHDFLLYQISGFLIIRKNHFIGPKSFDPTKPEWSHNLSMAAKTATCRNISIRSTASPGFFTPIDKIPMAIFAAISPSIYRSTVSAYPFNSIITSK